MFSDITATVTYPFACSDPSRRDAEDRGDDRLMADDAALAFREELGVSLASRLTCE